MKLFAYLAAAVMLAIVAVEAWGIDVAGVPFAAPAITFTDRTGIPLGTLGPDSGDTMAVPLARISPAFLRAIVASEDARFYRHGALDARSLLRAARDYVRDGRPLDGGSTIEMQLARMLDAIPGGMRGKLRQIAGAERIELRSSKDAILQAYVNRIPMGGDLYGVEAAARSYFGEPAADLDIAQAALLAAIPNDPTRLSPYANLAGLRARQRYVLERMVASGDLTPAAAHQAASETVHLRPPDRTLEAPQALFRLYRDLPPGSGGRVRTTIDAGLQRFVAAQTQSIVSALSAQHVTDAAALVIDNRTGEVLADVGSPDYFSSARLGQNDGVTALRQPGSALKPFLYELALERATIAPTTILPDVAQTYAIGDGKLYQPADYSGRFSGPVRVRYALANSLNVPAVQVLSSLGVATFLDRLHDLGFAHLNRPPGYYGLGLTLGSGEVSLWELAGAYLTMARSGSVIAPHLIAAPELAARRIGDPAQWQLVTDILADPHARVHSFGRHSVLEMPFPAAVKTGTSSDFRDTWTVGYTRDVTVAVWVGNFDGSPMRDVSGVTGAGPLWNRIVLHLGESSEPQPFDPPLGYVRARICALTGRAPRPGCPAVVIEWVRPGQLAASRHPEPGLGDDPRRVRITFPADGAVFVLNPTVDALQRSEQQIALHVAAPGTHVRWTANGKAVPLDASGTAFLPVALGSWSIRADDGRTSDRVTIAVVPQRHARAPGFTASAPP